MNSTNRGLNRAVLLVVGLVLLAVGAAVGTAVLWPAFGDAWKTTVGGAVNGLQSAHQASRVADGTTVSWVAIGVLGAMALVVIVAIVIVANLGGRRTRTVLKTAGSESPIGPITVQESFAADAIRGSLASHDEILSSSVSANRVKGSPVLHVSVTPRQNTSPQEVATLVARLTTNLATLTGHAVPTFVSIHSGLRARLAGDVRRLN